jgi:hypothetical protein
MVYLSTENIKTVRGKLKERWAGPFAINAVVAGGSAVRLDLPKQWKVHQTFHVNLVKPYVASRHQWPGRAQQDRVVPVIVDGDIEWEIEAIIGKSVEEVIKKERQRVVSNSGAVRWPWVKVTRDVLWYLVKWKGYDDVEASWRTVDDLQHCRELIAEYEAARGTDEVEGADSINDVELAVAWVMSPSLAADSGGRRGRPGVRCCYSSSVGQAAGTTYQPCWRLCSVQE